MLCEKCKIREANVQFTQIVNGEKSEHYYCAQCAQEMDFSNAGLFVEGGIPLAKLLSNLLAQTSVAKDDHPEVAQIVCPTCGTTYEDFINKSKFGCADCYKVFDILIGDNIKNLQGSDHHKGKRPRYGAGDIPESVKDDLSDDLINSAKSDDKETKLWDLKRELREAVAKEDFENAARLRDEIKALEGGTES